MQSRLVLILLLSLVQLPALAQDASKFAGPPKPNNAQEFAQFQLFFEPRPPLLNATKLSGRWICDSGFRENDPHGLGTSVPRRIDFDVDGTWKSPQSAGTYRLKDDAITLDWAPLAGANDSCHATKTCRTVSLLSTRDASGEEVLQLCIPYGWCGTGSCDPGRAVTCRRFNAEGSDFSKTEFPSSKNPKK